MDNPSLSKAIKLYRSNFTWRYRLLFVITLFGAFVTINLLIVSALSLAYSPSLNPYLLMIAVIGAVLEYFMMRIPNGNYVVGEGLRNGQENKSSSLTLKSIMQSLVFMHPCYSIMLGVFSVMGVTGICGYVVFPLLLVSYGTEWAYLSLGLGLATSVVDILIEKKRRKLRSR
jgi:hypothetical protein